MTDFNELELNKPVAEMEAEEAKETLSDFMEAHQKNQTAYDELQTKFNEAEEEYEETIEEYEERISEFTADKAEEAAEYVNMPAALLAERFEYAELEQMIEEAEESAEFAEDEESESEDSGDERLTSFSEKPEKGRTDGSGSGKRYRDRAKGALADQGFPAN